MNRADKMLEALNDGLAHDRHDIFQRAGCFFLTNNAASELRRRGLVIEHWREGTVDLYQLGSLEGADVGTGSSAPSSERERVQASADSSEHDGAGVRSPHEQLTLEAA